MERTLHERIWLYGNLTSNDITRLPNYPNSRDLSYVFAAALVLSIVRYCCESFLFIPLGRLLGLSRKTLPVRQNAVLEKAFRSKVDNDAIKQLAAEIKWTVHEVEIWLRRRRNIHKYSTLKKFSESMWRFTFYASVSTYATLFLWKKSWLWNMALLFEGSQISQSLTSDVWWYYMIEMGFYISLSVTQLTDVKRKDFMMMMVHHVFTLVLFYGTWMTNSVRAGAVVSFIHDLSDVPMEAFKVAKYIHWKSASNILFACFTIVWIMTRLIIFPQIVFVSWRDSYSYMAHIPFVFLNSVHTSLVILHIIWTWMILRVLLTVIRKGEVRDVRSDSEEEENTKTK